jgi:hypothetical protein
MRVRLCAQIRSVLPYEQNRQQQQQQFVEENVHVAPDDTTRTRMGRFAAESHRNVCTPPTRFSRSNHRPAAYRRKTTLLLLLLFEKKNIESRKRLQLTAVNKEVVNMGRLFQCDKSSANATDDNLMTAARGPTLINTFE